MELAVVSWLAMSSDEAVVEREAARGREPSWEGRRDCAVLMIYWSARKQEPIYRSPSLPFAMIL